MGVVEQVKEKRTEGLLNVQLGLRVLWSRGSSGCDTLLLISVG